MPVPSHCIVYAISQINGKFRFRSFRLRPRPARVQRGPARPVEGAPHSTACTTSTIPVWRSIHLYLRSSFGLPVLLRARPVRAGKPDHGAWAAHRAVHAFFLPYGQGSPADSFALGLTSTPDAESAAASPVYSSCASTCWPGLSSAAPDADEGAATPSRSQLVNSSAAGYVLGLSKIFSAAVGRSISGDSPRSGSDHALSGPSARVETPRHVSSSVAGPLVNVAARAYDALCAPFARLARRVKMCAAW